MKMVSLKQPCNQIQQISRVPTTPNTMVNCIGTLVRRRDDDTSLVMIVDIDFCSSNNKKIARQQVIKRSTNGIAMLENEAQGLYFRQCNLSTVLIGSYNHPSTCDEESLQSSYLAENRRRNCLYGTKPPQSYSLRSIYPRVCTKITPSYSFRSI